MPDLLLYAVVLIAALACPIHMWWAQRRGRLAACCPPGRDSRPQDLEALRARRAEVEAQLSEFDVTATSTGAAGRG